MQSQRTHFAEGFLFTGENLYCSDFVFRVLFLGIMNHLVSLRCWLRPQQGLEVKTSGVGGCFCWMVVKFIRFPGLQGALMMFADGTITSNTMITWPSLGSSDEFFFV